MVRNKGAPGIDGITVRQLLYLKLFFCFFCLFFVVLLFCFVSLLVFFFVGVCFVLVVWYADLRRQVGAEGDRHGAGSCVRAGLPSLLIRVPAGPMAHQALQTLHTAA